MNCKLCKLICFFYYGAVFGLLSLLATIYGLIYKVITGTKPSRDVKVFKLTIEYQEKMSEVL